MNKSELIEKLKSIFDNSVYEFAHAGKWGVNEYTDLGEINEVDSYGGEGQGETWYSIKYFPKLDLYVKVNGYYQSYNGTDFNDWEDAVNIVKPQQKTITVYE